MLHLGTGFGAFSISRFLLLRQGVIAICSFFEVPTTILKFLGIEQLFAKMRIAVETICCLGDSSCHGIQLIGINLGYSIGLVPLEPLLENVRIFDGTSPELSGPSYVLGEENKIQTMSNVGFYQNIPVGIAEDPRMVYEAICFGDCVGLRGRI